MNRRNSFLISLGSLCWAVAGAAQSAPSKSLSYDAATKTVTFALQAGAPPAPKASGSFNFNGFSNGAATLVVPPSSKIVMNFVNLDGVPHSAMLIPDADPMPAIGGDPAIPRAYTKDVTAGLPQGETDIMSFNAPATGSFRIFCGVPGHGQSGMWIRFKVDPNAKSPSWVTS
jgi:sulfocyanin